MRSLRAKITWSFLILIGCSVLGTGVFVALLLRSSYLDSLTDRLEKESKVLAETVQWTDQQALKKQKELYERTLGVHVDFFDVHGRPLGKASLDSKTGPQFPEVKNALASGKDGGVRTAIRDDYLHAAVPVQKGKEVVGAIRLSLDIKVVNQSLHQVWVSLVLGLLIAYALAAFFSSRIASGVTRPLEEITQVAVDIARKNFHRRVRHESGDEMAHLGQAINRMSHSLQKQMEMIRKNERRLNSIIESMESGLIMIDATGKVSLANRAFERMFGIPESDLIGRSFKQLTYPYDIRSLITECAEKNMRIRKEIHLYYPEEKMLEANLAPMWVEKNGVGVVVVFHDLTAIRRLEQLRKDFVANVSHELKTPITSIRGFAETLLDGAMSDQETCREFLGIIHGESLRLERLIGDLLELTQIESKRMILKLEQVPVKNLLENVSKTVKDRIFSKGLSFSMEIPKPFEVEVDQDRFRQILLNLLSNAMNYTPRGGCITVRATGDDKEWTLVVRDTGIGIPAEDLPRIFERFYRVDKARSRDSGGTGLGLAIVKHLVEVHQGKIDVESQVGQGTTFRLTFPLHLKEDEIV
ncbi:PAS domain S-box protein [Thermoactinomyces intermedius]|jgi:two-component system, OmpR family, phosphate regulon sensor histidine kinase PhoR|uniref:histidine kinase n=1 Tax=Thermoactinomyces intermedius TaxID=2024 RepID=A0A8I1A4R1_THEIN|nr:MULTISPECIES: ATP-binding protein [Thermoactinomyces]MBA4549435.1 PAS domain S-box protein [Thermoactinomyces intermedius]MBA4836826.1 PAS domain S-box protein [Thermoactinomyces intermedius]MBH8594799.1 PAS domain S-box protein [Thermoactinomyces intermedius]MBH8602278.1 PAS domain S-box protein [Thermoactinomyces sp. CICC 23799]